MENHSGSFCGKRISESVFGLVVFDPVVGFVMFVSVKIKVNVKISVRKVVEILLKSLTESEWRSVLAMAATLVCVAE